MTVLPKDIAVKKGQKKGLETLLSVTNAQYVTAAADVPSSAAAGCCISTPDGNVENSGDRSLSHLLGNDIVNVQTQTLATSSPDSQMPHQGTSSYDSKLSLQENHHGRQRVWGLVVSSCCAR